MGSPFLTLKEAANRLGKSQRTLRNYFKEGLLKRMIHNGRPVVAQEAVEELALIQGRDYPEMSKSTFYKTLSRLDKLEEQMKMVQERLVVVDEFLHPGPNVALELYKQALDSLGRRMAWDLGEVELWASLFIKFDETTLDILEKAIPGAHSWRVFFRLNQDMIHYLGLTLAKGQDIHLQALLHRLDEGRKRIRACLLVKIESGETSVPEEVIRSLSSHKEELLRTLLASNSSTGLRDKKVVGTR